MTKAKPQPLGKTCEREILYLFINSTAESKIFSHNLSQPEDKILASKFVPSSEIQTQTLQPAATSKNVLPQDCTDAVWTDCTDAVWSDSTACCPEICACWNRQFLPRNLYPAQTEKVLYGKVHYGCN